MKKLLAVLVALAMVLSMTVVSFAYTDADGNEKVSPAEILSKDDYNALYEKVSNGDILGFDDLSAVSSLVENGYATHSGLSVEMMSWEEAWADYYSFVMGASESPVDAITEIVGTVTGGAVDPGTAIAGIGNAAMGGIGGDGGAGDMSGIVDTIMGAISGIIGGDENAEPDMTVEEYYPIIVEMIENGATATEVETKIGEDLTNNVVGADQLGLLADWIEYATDPACSDVTSEVATWLRTVDPSDYEGGNSGTGGGIGGIELPDFGDISLPIDIGGSEGGSFLDTILGILGSIGDLFGGGESGNGGSGNGSGSSDSDSDWGDDWGDDIPDTGDTSFIAVAAIAAVAGAAFVLTRKKSDNAE